MRSISNINELAVGDTINASSLKAIYHMFPALRCPSAKPTEADSSWVTYSHTKTIPPSGELFISCKDFAEAAYFAHAVTPPYRESGVVTPPADNGSSSSGTGSSLDKDLYYEANLGGISQDDWESSWAYNEDTGTYQSLEEMKGDGYLVYNEKADMYIKYTDQGSSWPSVEYFYRDDQGNVASFKANYDNNGLLQQVVVLPSGATWVWDWNGNVIRDAATWNVVESLEGQKDAYSFSNATDCAINKEWFK